MPFIAKISVTYKLMEILKHRCSFLNNESGVEFDFPKNHLIPMGPYAPKDSCNFFHWLFKKFVMGFIAFVNRFKPKKEITLIEEGKGTIINYPHRRGERDNYI